MHCRRLVLILKIIRINSKGLLQVDFFKWESSSINKFSRDALFSRRVRVNPGGILAGLCLSSSINWNFSLTFKDGGILMTNFKD